MKKFLSLVLCIFVVLSLFSFSAVAETEALSDESGYQIIFYTYEKLDLSGYEGLEAPFDFYGVPIRSVELDHDLANGKIFVYHVMLDKNDVRPPEAKEAFEAVETFWGIILKDPDIAVMDIDFTQRVFCAPWIRGFRYTLLKTYEELQNFILFCEEEGDGSKNEFAEYAATLDESYFDEKAIFIARDSSESGVEYRVDHIYVSEATEVQMEYSYYDIGRKADYSVTYFITAEVNKADVRAVDCVSAVKKLISEYNIDFEYQYFNMGHDIGEYVHGANYKPVIAQTFDELNEFKNSVSQTCDPAFLEFVDRLSADYFDKNALILVVAGAGCTGYRYNITSVTSYETGITLGYAYYGGYATATGSTIIAVTIKKSDALNLENSFSPEVTSQECDDRIIWEYRIESNILGDVDGDKEITADDYIALKRIYFGMEKYSDYGEETEMRSDIDGNGKVTADDYILLKRVYFGTYKIG